MAKLNCNLCGSSLTEKIYDSGRNTSLTSLSTVYEGQTQVFICESCGHAQSLQLQDIDAYYESEYNFLVASEEEDQIYEVLNDKKVYRTEHQVKIMRQKLDLKPGTRILDYGCAKSSTMLALSSQIDNIEISLFDVSERYKRFWKTFVPSERCATHKIPLEWGNTFDIITSLFSLEHIANPGEALNNILYLLKSDGILHGIVPNVLTNTADLIVIDHVNHFTPQSLSYLLKASGFEVIDIDDMSHRGSIVFNARKSPNYRQNAIHNKEVLESTVNSLRQIGKFWQQAGLRIQAFENALASDARVALYGAGFYGSFIASWLKYPQRIQHVIDQNSYLQGRMMHGTQVIAPSLLPHEVDTLYVGLNPLNARRIIESTKSICSRNLYLFYL